MTTGAAIDYPQLVGRFQRLVTRATPPDGTVLVVSKGDPDLVQLGARQAWHFPQRADGVYAGYHPDDSAVAIQHLEALRERGAEFLALPATSAWWLEHYPELVEHLHRIGRLVVNDEGTGIVYTLFQPGQRRGQVRPQGRDEGWEPAAKAACPPRAMRRRLLKALHGDVLADVEALFDAQYYAEQCELQFPSAEEALLHYLDSGYLEGFTPHRLFDPAWYTRKYPEVRISGVNPLVHFAQRSPEEGQSPSPYFDTEYYLARWSDRPTRVNALVHYLRSAAENKAFHPNPLFRGGFYVRTYPDAAESGLTPLEHFLDIGCGQGRLASELHKNMLQQLERSSRGRLLRGKWKRGTVLLFSGGPLDDITQLAARLGDEYHLDPLLVRLTGGADDVPPSARHLVLDDYQLAGDVTRPSAIRLLVRALQSMRPLLALSNAHEFSEGIALAGVPNYCFLHEPDDRWAGASQLADALTHASRVIVPSSHAFHAVGKTLGRYPVTATRWPAHTSATADDQRHAMAALLALAEADFSVDLTSAAQAGSSTTEAQRIIIPCSDWALSGVNAALEAVGLQLLRLGWRVEILFTRSEDHVLRSVGDASRLPRLPYRFLHRDEAGVLGLWSALLAEVESQAPCILFTSYDFLSNSVVPALTDRVGVVLWVQADDGDYYEQVYRLGRYCNAVVSVSDRIRVRINELNPVIGSQTQVIHNASVRHDEVASHHRTKRDRLRVIYSGRLVEYQKRVLDFVAVAKELDRIEVPYSMTLIGEFSRRESTRERFETMAADHLSDGRIVLPGRLARAQILDQLDQHDVFLLLSAFEGLPLAVIEAMARGCVPVVAEMESGIPELITDDVNGVIVAGRDYEKWAHVMAELWQDRARLARLSRKARSTIRKRFTTEKVGSQFDRLFAQILDEVTDGLYQRPQSLHWGEDRVQTGDVLPPPILHRPAATKIEGL